MEVPSTDRPHRKILLIEDNRVDAFIVSSHLERARHLVYEVKTVHSAGDALKFLQAQTPDCLLVDYRLPDSDGVELIRSLRKEEKLLGLPIVLVSGLVDETLIIQALRSGAQDYVLKEQVTAEALERAISNSIEKMALLKRVARQAEQKRNLVTAVTQNLTPSLLELKASLAQLEMGLSAGQPCAPGTLRELARVHDGIEMIQKTLVELASRMRTEQS